MKKCIIGFLSIIFTIIYCYGVIPSQKIDLSAYSPNNRIYYSILPPAYYRVDYEWYLTNSKQNTLCYKIDGSLYANESGGTYDIAYNKALSLFPSNITARLGFVDTGIATNHPDFSHLSFIDSRNFIPLMDVHDIQDYNGHGTGAGSIIFAKGGLKGLLNITNPIICKTDWGQYDTGDAIIYCVNHNAKIINWDNSIANVSMVGNLSNALSYAQLNGVIVVSATENNNIDVDVVKDYPASWHMDNVITVTSVDRYGNLYASSAWGKTSIHLAAPGRLVLNCNGNTNWPYVYQTGTSQAAPMVSSALIVIASKYPNQTYHYWIERLLKGVTPEPTLTNVTISGGTLNFYNPLTNDIPCVTISNMNLTISGTFTNSNWLIQHSVDLVKWTDFLTNYSGTYSISNNGNKDFFRARLF